MGIGDPESGDERKQSGVPPLPTKPEVPDAAPARPDMRAEIQKNRTAGEKATMAVLIIVLGIPLGLLVFGALLFGVCLLGR